MKKRKYELDYVREKLKTNTWDQMKTKSMGMCDLKGDKLLYNYAVREMETKEARIQR